MKIVLSILLSMLVGAASVTTVAAVPVGYAFSGVIDGAPVPFAPGSTFSGSVWFDTQENDRLGADPSEGWYDFAGAEAYLEVQLLSDLIKASPVTVYLRDKPSQDMAHLYATDDVGDTATVNGSLLSVPFQIAFALFGPPTALNSDSISEFSVDGFTSGQFQFLFGPGYTTGYSGTLTSWSSITAVPLPAGVALIASALGLLGIVGRGKRKAAACPTEPAAA